MESGFSRNFCTSAHMGGQVALCQNDLPNRAIKFAASTTTWKPRCSAQKSVLRFKKDLSKR